MKRLSRNRLFAILTFPVIAVWLRSGESAPNSRLKPVSVPVLQVRKRGR
jgi:hypothetical protein